MTQEHPASGGSGWFPHGSSGKQVAVVFLEKINVHQAFRGVSWIKDLSFHWLWNHLHGVLFMIVDGCPQG